MLWLQISILFIAAFSNILVAIAVLLRGLSKLNNISFFVFSLAMAGWTLGIASFMLSQDESLAFFWAKFYYFCPILVTVPLAFFVMTFPNKTGVSVKWVIPLFIGFLTISLPLLFIDSFVTESLVYHAWGKEIVLDKLDYLIYTLYILILFPLCLSKMFRISRGKGIFAAQAELFFYGFLVAYAFGVFFDLILPWVGNYQLIWIGPIFTSFFIVSIAYSIIRHRMFDIKLIIARSIGYVLAAGTLLFAYGFVTFVILNNILFSEANLSTLQILTLTIMAVLLASIMPPLLQFFNKITNRIFYRDAYDPQSFIDQLNKVLATNYELETLLSKSSEVIKSNIRAEYCLFEINPTNFMKARSIGTETPSATKDNVLKFLTHYAPKISSRELLVADNLTEEVDLRAHLTKNDIAVLGRIAPADSQNILGYLILGQKQSGNSYTYRDIRILSIILKELLIAVQNALHLEEIENFNKTLQEKIDQATNQLQRQNDRLKLLDQTKDDFIGMASHQLRTPLTAIKGYLSMVLEGDAGKLTPLQKRMLSQSFMSAQRMVYLISDLLNVSRLRTGKFSLEMVPTDLSKVVQDEIKQLKEAAKVRDLDLIYEKPDNFPVYMLDETKLRQVIMNFIDNAVYYTKGGGSIKVTLRDKPQSVELTVEDTGIGVPKSEQMHVFTKYYRAHNAQVARPDGTGLGLFMAKKVVIAHGGAVIFKSVEDRGSTFGFTIPKSSLKLAPTTSDKTTKIS